jgi:hypothetical protein
MTLPTIQIERFPNSQQVNTVTGGGNGSVRPANSTFLIRHDYPGLDTVLDEMKRLVKEYKGNPDIRNKAVGITSGIKKDSRTGLPNRRDYHAIATAIYAWMKKNIEYVRDPDGIEWLQTPLKTLEIGYGDCDDQSILAGALLSSIGVPTRFKVVKSNPQKPDAFTHVYLEYKANGSWKAFDPTLHTKAGDGLSDSQIFGARTVSLSDGLAGCNCQQGLQDSILTKKSFIKNWKLIGFILISSGLGFYYWKQQLAKYDTYCVDWSDCWE